MIEGKIYLSRVAMTETFKVVIDAYTSFEIESRVGTGKVVFRMKIDGMTREAYVSADKMQAVTVNMGDRP